MLRRRRLVGSVWHLLLQLLLLLLVLSSLPLLPSESTDTRHVPSPGNHTKFYLWNFREESFIFERGTVLEVH